MDPNQAQQLDQDAVRLAKSIRYTESRDREDAKGGSGEAGLYQWMPETWKATTNKYGLDPADFSRENQNKAAYMQIKELKDQGVPPDRIAAFWNMGGKALTHGYEGNVGVNKHGVKYDTPAYVRSVQQAYERLKAEDEGGQPMAPETAPIGPSTVGHEQYGTPDAEQPRTLEEKAVEVGKGALKGLGGGLVDLARMGESFANQTAGRGVSALLGRGFRPMTAEERGNPVTVSGTAEANKVDELTKSRNAYQTGGKVLEFGAEMLVPGLGTKKVMEARRLAGAFSEALNVVAPKETAKVIQKAYEAGRAKVSGFMRHVTMTPDQQTERAAQAIEDLVKAGKVSAKKTAAENSAAVHDAIGKEADGLVAQIRAMEVQPVLSPEELGSVFRKASAEIEKNPYLEESAKTSAKKMFDLFMSKLPKGRALTAEDVLQARKAFDAEIRSMKPTAFDPRTENATSMALRAIRQGLNDLVAEKAPDVAVKESLAKQSAMYDALENIATKGAKEMGTDIKARYFQRHPFQKGLVQTGIGAGIGSGLVGSWAAGKATGE
jgi:hypothetical protein